jgi:hypothetical protein
VRELNPNTFTRMQHLSGFAFYATSFTDLSGRSLNFNKAAAGSDIFVMYMDTLGWHMTCGADAGDIRLVVDGAALAANRAYGSTAYGWYMMPFSFLWYFQGMSAGAHNVRLQAVRYSCASDILIGWSDNDVNNIFA